jgi:hypothetical protein
MRHAMPEATVLYVVTAVVVAGLLVWLGIVLARAKTPWGRPPPAPAPAGPADADATAQATVVTMGQAEAKAPEPPEPKAD